MNRALLYGLVCLLGIAAFSLTPAFAGVAIKGGVDVSGTHSLEGNDDDVDMGFSISAEIYKRLAPFIELGGGAEYQIPRSIEGSSGNFGFIPVYGALRIPIKLPIVTPFAVGRVGYSFFTGNEDYKGTGGELKGGFYYGFGGGVILFKFLIVEGTYSVSNGVLSWGGSDFDIDYSKIGIQAGINF